jgi:hypothetical protein
MAATDEITVAFPNSATPIQKMSVSSAMEFGSQDAYAEADQAIGSSFIVFVNFFLALFLFLLSVLLPFLLQFDFFITICPLFFRSYFIPIFI